MKQIIKMFIFTIQMSVMFYLSVASIESDFNVNNWDSASVSFLLVIHNLLWIGCGIFIITKIFKK